MRTYLIKSGFSFRISSEKVLGGGDTIYLGDDVAQAHAEKLDEIPVEVVVIDLAPAADAWPAFQDQE